MRWLRLFLALIAAKYRSRLSVNETSTLRFTVWLNEIDVSIMNHAAMMTVMEAGRIDLMVRSGFFKLARNEKWYFPTSAISVQFTRPLKIFQKATLSTRVIHVATNLIYLEQKITRGEKEIASCIVKATIKKGRETLNIPSVINRLGFAEFPIATTGTIETFDRHYGFLKEEV